MADKARVLELKTALKEKVAFIDEGIDRGVKVDGQNVEVSAESATAIRKAMTDAQEIKGLIHAEQFGAETKRWLEEPTDESVAMAQHAGASEVKHSHTLGELFTDSDEFQSFVKSGARTMPTPYELKAMDLGGMGTPRMERKDVWTGSATSSITRTLGGVQFDPMIPRPQRTARVRDLFPAVATNSNLIDYFKVTGWAEHTETDGRGSAGSVRERAAADGISAAASPSTDTFGLKPKSNLTFTSDQAPVRLIAHWEAAHRNVLQDVPQLEATINNELLYGLRLEEDRQILSGSGNNEELKGLLLTSNVQTYSTAVLGDAPNQALEPRSDTLRRATTKVILAYYQSTGFVLHPNDWEQLELQKNGIGAYMLVTNIAIGAQQQVWRQPVVDTPAIAEGTALCGAFGLGAQLYDRQQANIRVAEQHADFFIRNAVAILCEERLALAVKRPESFVKISLLTEVPSD